MKLINQIVKEVLTYAFSSEKSFIKFNMQGKQKSCIVDIYKRRKRNVVGWREVKYITYIYRSHSPPSVHSLQVYLQLDARILIVKRFRLR